MIAHWQAQAIVSAELEDAGIRYAWVITHETEWGDDDAMTWVPLDVAGPSTATDEEIALARKGHVFRLDYDGDGPALKGRMWASDAKHPRDSGAAFAPLDDFGRGSHGAVSILYRNENNQWEEL